MRIQSPGADVSPGGPKQCAEGAPRAEGKESEGEQSSSAVAVQLVQLSFLLSKCFPVLSVTPSRNAFLSFLYYSSFLIFFGRFFIYRVAFMRMRIVYRCPACSSRHAKGQENCIYECVKLRTCLSYLCTVIYARRRQISKSTRAHKHLCMTCNYSHTDAQNFDAHVQTYSCK